MMFSKLPRYFLHVVCVFVGFGPLIPVFPAVANPAFLPLIWMAGAPPAFLAALYYFAFTCSWFDARAPSKRIYRFLLFGALGGISGALGMMSFFQLNLFRSQFEQLLISSTVFSYSMSVIGGSGAAIIVVWLDGKLRNVKSVDS